MARYIAPDRRERSRSFARKIDAERFLSEQEAGMARGTWRDPAAGRVALADFSHRVLDESPGLAPSTRRRYRSLLEVHIIPVLGDVALADVRPEHLRGLVRHLADQGLAPKTIRHAYTLLVGLLGVAVEEGRIAAVPKPRPKPGQRSILPPVPKPRHRYLDHAEVARLAATPPIAPRYTALVYLGAYGALRWGELAALRVEHLRLLERRVEVVETTGGREPKWGSSGTVTVPAFVAEQLGRHLAAFPPGPEGLVFTSPEGRPLSYPNFYRRVWRPAVRAAGLEPPPTPHDLRHTAVALAISAGAHPKQIQELCRHRSFNTTMTIYGGLFPSLAEELAERLDDGARRAASVAGSGTRRDQDGTSVVRLEGRGRH
ncbi:MAG: hypothetical protein KatS3mg013_1214 [Actinomycetota bacterium]|nr:MAG: hypothetical protein KatS3mg013_1214 [Actinomycetota bacterium]